MNEYQIKEITNDNIDAVALLREEAEVETKLVAKMIDEWKSGENTFSKPAEKAWGLFVDDQCIAFTGINIDPYYDGNDGSVARIRQVYVAKAYRGQGLSRVLMELVLEHAKKYFTTIRLATDNPIALHVYESYGFAETGTKATNGKPVYSLTF